MKKSIIIMLLSVCALSVFAQRKQTVNWLSFEDAFAKQKLDSKPILVDIYTDWCGWCKKMDKDAYSDRSIINYINDNFHPIKFNAEQKGEILYNGKKYINDGSMGLKSTHQLAQLLLNNQMSYPSTVFITEDLRVFPVAGYLTVADFEPLLIYLAEKVYLSTEFVEFKHEFENAFNPNVNLQNEGVISWLNIEDAYQRQQKERKKIFVFIHSEFVNSSKIMTASSLRHPYISEFINSNFLPVKLDFDSMDTITLGRDTFVNSKNMLGYPNQLVIALLNPDFRYPALLFFDDDFKLLFTLRGFYSPKTLEKYLNFVKDEVYKDKTVDFKQYYDSFKSKIAVDSAD